MLVGWRRRCERRAARFRVSGSRRSETPAAAVERAVRELEAVTPDSLKPLLSDLFEHSRLGRAHRLCARGANGAGSWA